MSKLALDRLLARFPADVLETHAHRGDETAVVHRERLREVGEFLRDDSECAFDMMTDLTCVDLLPGEPRFHVVVHLYSTTRRHRLRVKAPVPEGDPVAPSLTPVWRGADWFEREAWDLYGIRFDGHPDLRRVLLHESFVGHPLRKDYRKDMRQPLFRREDAGNRSGGAP